MKFGTLDFIPVAERLDLVAAPVAKALKNVSDGVYISAIDPTFSDTAEFCTAYDIDMDVSANCVILEAKRADKIWYAACVVLAADRADVNGAIRRHLDARKISFAPMAQTVSLSGMEYGGITPIGLPADWPILVDAKVAQTEQVIIGGGSRGSKLLISGDLIAQLPNASVISLAKQLTD